MNRTQKTALRGMLIAVAFVLSWLEAQLPPLAMVPGVKLGLTNLVVLVAIYRLSTMDALVINGIRILLVAFTFGNMFSLLYSFAGGMLSTIVMLLLKRSGRFRLSAWREVLSIISDRSSLRWSCWSQRAWRIILACCGSAE